MLQTLLMTCTHMHKHCLVDRSRKKSSPHSLPAMQGDKTTTALTICDIHPLILQISAAQNPKSTALPNPNPETARPQL